MATDCFTVVRGKRARITRLTETLSPAPTSENCRYVVTSGYISVGFTAAVEAGDEITQPNANGDLCVNERSNDQFQRWELSIDWCEVDPDAFEMIAGYPLEVDGAGDSVGFRTPEGQLDANFGLELWTGIGGTATSYGYLLLPAVGSALLNSFTVENGSATFTTDAVTKGGNQWGTGPYNVIDHGSGAQKLAVAMATDEHLLMRTTTVAPPAAVCGCQPTA